jgi:hypothetical protein
MAIPDTNNVLKLMKAARYAEVISEDKTIIRIQPGFDSKGVGSYYDRFMVLIRLRDEYGNLIGGVTIPIYEDAQLIKGYSPDVMERQRRILGE